VAKAGRVLQDLVADAPFRLVMDVGPAHAQPIDSEQDRVGPVQFGLGNFTDL
jgi:hypothetical protein